MSKRNIVKSRSITIFTLVFSMSKLPQKHVVNQWVKSWDMLEEYRFNRNLLLYHPQTDKWTTLGEYEQGARAGAVIVSQDGFHYIINGELKPGIRTNEINRIKEKRR